MDVRVNGTQEALNFGAGPSKLPREVLLEVQRDLISYGGTGMSIMEMSHRGAEYTKVNENAQNLIRELLNVPANYKILFMQGGGQGAFAAICMNLMNRTGTADYMVTGIWSGKAAEEAEKYGEVRLVFPKQKARVTSLPDESAWTLNPGASFLYYCANETVDGIEFPFVPKPLDGVPLVCDMSSNIMTRGVDVTKYGVIFGGAQKNVGPAGAVIVIIRDDLLGSPMKICPSIFDFTNIHKTKSVPNTPATFTVYVMERVLEWIRRNGGVPEMEKQSALKSGLLYKAIEESNGYYYCPIATNCRSRINVTFRIGGPNGNDGLESKFLVEAEKRHMFQLKGHRLAGGIRASLYNAVSLSDVQYLVAFMKEFHKKNPL